jgi:hypothetical protein
MATVNMPRVSIVKSHKRRDNWTVRYSTVREYRRSNGVCARRELFICSNGAWQCSPEASPDSIDSDHIFLDEKTARRHIETCSRSAVHALNAFGHDELANRVVRWSHIEEAWNTFLADPRNGTRTERAHHWSIRVRSVWYETYVREADRRAEIDKAEGDMWLRSVLESP